MQAIRKRYFPALAEYIRGGKEASLIHANELGKQLYGLNYEEIIAIHEECIQALAANVETKDAIQLYHRSFVFLMELMVATRFKLEVDSAGDIVELPVDQKISEIREKLVRSNRSFEEEKNKYENVLQHLDSGIALFDSDGILVFINLQMAKFFDIPRKTLAGRNIRQILRHSKLNIQTRRTILRLYREIFMKRNRYYEFQHKDGKHLLATVTYGDQLNGDFLFSIKDVSEYKQIEQSAMQNDKLAMLGKIAAAIAHEIRNPLTSIRGFIQLLQPYLLEVGKEEYARIILTEIDRANDIIYEFLNSSKPSAPMKQSTSIELLIREVVMLTESEALLRNCEISMESYHSEATVSIDIKQVKQVILNIVKNSLDAVEEVQTERRGRIDIILTINGQYAEITIADNGKGMDKTTKGKLFDPFFTTKQEGTGLGLSVSYRIIRNHGGTISVNSDVGSGTKFIIYLPLAE
ncbi:PAS-domain containing protein [Paenibacillus sp. GSMTC-2017]|uniref:ATP-binding protein n=1 Tax=Paenibacillus sp. GSMTC-2017 TaxID=2794350 RepID=UPI0018D700D8|nr:ATP-binding protein [Paenibacillus sp. GSMTC-2017]MBH5317370.1 PAS-domain containing protein [Paenibacillus sp. GSMTC-2017]